MKDDGIGGAIILFLFVAWVIWLIFIKKPKVKKTTIENAIQVELARALRDGNENPEMILLLLGHDKCPAEKTMLLKYYYECVHSAQKHYDRIETIARIQANKTL